MRALKILYVHRTRGKGVEGVHIWGIVNALKSFGHDVLVVSPAGIQTEITDGGENNSNNRKHILFEFISAHVPELVFEFAELLNNFVSLKLYNKLVLQFPPDLIYERYAIFSISGVKLANKKKIPFVLEVNYTSLTPLVRKRSNLLKPFAKMIDKWLFRRSSALVVVSTYLRNHLINDYGVEESKILVCPNAADPHLFNTEINPVKTINHIHLDNRKVIGFVGTFSPWHGVDLLVESISIVARQNPSILAVLIGDGPEKKRIKRLVSDLGLNKNVVFTGQIDHEILPRYIAAFDIGVMPDSNVYGSPMKIFEYMSLGKPVVVPSYGPLHDVIEHRVHGMIFEPGNKNSLAENILELLTDNVLFESMRVSARKHIENKHNWINNASTTMDFVMKKTYPLLE